MANAPLNSAHARRLLRCGYSDCVHLWTRDRPGEPERCPKCKRRDWKKGQGRRGRPATKAPTPATPQRPVSVTAKPLERPVSVVRKEKVQAKIAEGKRPAGRCPHDWMNPLLCPVCRSR
jgi:hypothetical protein